MTKLTPKDVLRGMMQVAPVAADLKRTLESDGFKEIAVETWFAALSDMETESVGRGFMYAAKYHTERNITPAHLRRYSKMALQHPEMNANHLLKKEEAFRIEQTDAQRKSVGAMPHFKLDDPNPLYRRAAEAQKKMGIGAWAKKQRTITKPSDLMGGVK